MKTYDTYLFDLDGTLTDTSGIWVEIFRDTLTDLGKTGLSDTVIAQYTHNWNSLSGLGLSVQDIAQFADLARRRASERLPAAPLHDGGTNIPD